MHTVTPCSTEWPSFELFLPVDDHHSREYVAEFLPAFQAFWPVEKVPIRLVLDAETSWQKLANRLNASQPALFSVNKRPANYSGLGHDRQQLIMFWADNYTTADYIGFIDSDAALITKIHPYDIFREDFKPIVRGIFGISTWYGHQDWAKFTFINKL